ncbi:hypothetical protein [Maricaulis sp. CAU 1757]
MFARSVLMSSLSAALFVGVAFSQALSSSFTVENATAVNMVAVYAGPSSSPEWGPNILDTAYIASGQAVVVTVHSETGECLFDFRYDFADGARFEEYGINICAINGQTFVITGK